MMFRSVIKEEKLAGVVVHLGVGRDLGRRVGGLIAGHPAVADVVVVAYPDEVLGERACAVVVPRPGQTVSLAEIVAYLREIGIATFKLPERVEVRDELPRNPLGKILKRELRDELRGS
jgi:non-ribosomal peptide synthetase component E (peptide arylation enzyme)